MKRVLLVLFLVLLSGVVGLSWLGRPYLTERLRLHLERQITAAAGRPSRIQELRVSIVPPRVHAAGIVIGSEPPLAEIAAIDARLFTLASVSEGRPVLAIRVESPGVDLSHLPKGQPSSPPEPQKPQSDPRLPPLHLERIEVSRAHLRFRMDDKNNADLTVAHLAGELRTGLLRQRLTARAEVHGVELQRKSYRVKLDDVHADGGVDAGGLFVNSASVRGEGITASASATTTPHRHTAVADFEPRLLGVIVDELAFIGGQAHVEGTLNGDLANPIADAQVTMPNAALAQRTLGDLTTHFRRAGATLHFDDVRLAGPTGEATGTVELVVLHETPIQADVNLQGIDLQRLLALIGTPVPFANVFSGTAVLRGGLDPTDLTIAGTGTLQTTVGGTPQHAAQWDANVRVHPHALDARLDVTQAAGNHVTGKVTLDGPEFGGGIDVRASDISALNVLVPRPVHALALTGRGEATATFSGTTEHPVVSGRASLRDLTVVGAAVPRLDGDFTIAAQKLTSQHATLETAGGGATLQGSLALDASTPNDWQLTLRDLDTDLVLGLLRGFSGSQLPLSGGTLNGTFRCRGAWARADTQADLAAKSLRVAGEPVERVELQTTTQLPQWTVRLNAVHAAHETLTIDAAGEGTSRLKVTADATPMNLANFLGAGRRRLTGTVKAHAEVSGSLLEPEGSLEMTGTAVAAGDHTLGDVAVRVSGARGVWSIEGAAFANTFTADATVQARTPFPYTLAARWHDTNLAAVIGAEESLRATTSGALDLSGALQDLGTPSGTVRVTALDLSRGEYRVSAAEPIRLDADRGHFRITSLVLAAQESRLTVTGEMTTAGEVRVDADGQGNLVLLELIGRPFSAARGPFSVTARIRHGTEGRWDLGGQVTVRDAVLDFGLPVAFTKTNATLRLAGSTIRIESLTGKAGGGDFTIGGTVDLAGGPELAWTFQDLALSVTDGLEARCAGHGTVVGTWKAVTVDGTIEVLNALYDRKIELTDLLPWFREQITPAPRTKPPVTEVQLDLIIYARGGVYIDNNVAKAEMWLDLEVTGPTQKPVVTGTIGFLSGEVGVRKRTFTITAGTIDFRDRFRINPVLNITAESRISTPDAEYTVTAVVTGTADEPRVQFSADDPNLSQMDVFSLVASGKTAAQLQREGGGVSAADALALLPTGDVEKRVGQFVGVDRFEVEAAQARNTGAIEPRVTIGKDLTERFRASVSTSFGVEAQRTVQLEYRLTRRISLLGSWEGQTQSRAGAFGGDIKFRYDFRRLRFSLFDGETRSTPQADGR